MLLQESSFRSLWMNLYFERPVFRSPQLERLETVIQSCCSTWATQLVVREHEDARVCEPVNSKQSLSKAILSLVADRLAHGHVILNGSSDRIIWYLDSCDQTVPPELNMVSIECHDLDVVHDELPSIWASHLFEALCSTLPIRYGNAYADEEFREKNMIQDAGVTKALGVQLLRSLPGLYWLNYFGPSYVRLIGRDRFLSLSSELAKECAGGFLVTLASHPELWRSQEYQDRERAVLQHLGAEFFFSMANPSRSTHAPTFEP